MRYRERIKSLETSAKAELGSNVALGSCSKVMTGSIFRSQLRESLGDGGIDAGWPAMSVM